ncbi:MAG: response regulator [Anaerolineae bacterium]|nr:response regulator [Anaerolineae bacterium]
MTDKTILVVEDDPDGQEMIATMLQHLQYQVDAADNAEEAAQILSNSGGGYSAIIIDLALPGKDGWELLADILDNPSTNTIPCIAVTAHHTSKLREDTIRAGFTAYFPKPIDATALGRQLASLI